MNKSLRLFKVWQGLNFLILFIFSGTLSGYGHTIYLTIDDGPLGAENNIIEVLEEERVPATLFLVGKHMVHNKNRAFLYRMKHSRWLEVANHSYSHAHEKYRNFYRNRRKVLKDMRLANRVFELERPPYISRLPGRDVFRLPGLYRNDSLLPKKQTEQEKQSYNLLYKNGFFIYGWDIEWRYNHKNKKPQSIDQLVRKIKYLLDNNKTLRKHHLILLTHEQMFSKRHMGARGLKNLIRTLKQQGFTIRALRDYPI